MDGRGDFCINKCDFSPTCWSSQKDNFVNYFHGKKIHCRHVRIWDCKPKAGIPVSQEPCRRNEKTIAYQFFEDLFLREGHLQAMYIHPCFTMHLKPTWRPFLLADIVICNEWYVEVVIVLYDKCSQLDHAIILQFGSRGQFGCYNWGLQETQFVLLGTHSYKDCQ